MKSIIPQEALLELIKNQLATQHRFHLGFGLILQRAEELQELRANNAVIFAKLESFDFMPIPQRKRTKGFVTFDIETCPQDEARLLAIAPDFKPNANLKDPDKIAANIAEKRASYLADSALHWLTCEVALICLGSDSSNIQAISEGTEAEKLEKFLSIASYNLQNGIKLIGHNIIGFDLPIIVNRARLNGLRIPESIGQMNNGRWYWNENIVDTLQVITFGNKQDIAGNSVDAIAKSCGFPSKLGDGANFYKLWQQNKAGAISYCKRDVEIEILIASMLGYK